MTSVGATSSTPTTPTTTTSSTSGSTAPLQSIGGLATGLDTNAIISALVDQRRALEQPTKDDATLANVSLQSYALIRQDLTTLSGAALALSKPSAWRALSATSSDETIAKVTAGTGTFGGTLTFTVDNLAAADTKRSANTFASTATGVAANATLFVAAGGKALGFSTLASDNALATGTHTIQVTQSSSAAVKTGGTALGGAVTIDNTNDTVNVSVNGVAQTLTLAHGTYNQSQLASAVQDALNSAGAPATATLNGSNKLVLTTSREGSAASIQVTGGNGLTALGLTTDGSAITGTDGKVSVDGGAAQTFNSLDAGSSIVLNAAAGTITGVLNGGLRTGSVTGNNISTGDGSLGTVVANINAAGAGVTATAVQVGSNSYRLQITSNTAGANNGSNIADSAWNGNVGGMVTLTAGSDAQVTVGSGPGAYSVTSATNSISGLLPGVTVQLISKSANPVTVTVNRDDSGLADKVQAIVDAANKVQNTISQLTAYDPNSKQASPLTGDPIAEGIMNSLTNAVIKAVSDAVPQSPGLAGIAVDGNGKFTFDKSKFTAAFDANPNGVINLFAQGGSASNAALTFVSAGDRAVAGSYDVNVTTAAAQATDTGLTGAWPPVSPPTVKVRVGTTEVSYAVKNGDARADVAAGLNSAFASAGLALQAVDTGSGVKITTNNYGSAATFDVDWNGGGYATKQGVDVAGTIGGKAATGTGQQLMASFDDPNMSGLAVIVNSTSTGDFGNLTYDPGVAQRLQTTISNATDFSTGLITTEENGLKSRIQFDSKQVSDMELQVTQYETMLRAQWATLESTIQTMKSQAGFLSSQLGTGSSSGGSSSSGTG